MEHKRLRLAPSGVCVFWSLAPTSVTTPPDPVWHDVGILYDPLRYGNAIDSRYATVMSSHGLVHSVPCVARLGETFGMEAGLTSRAGSFMPSGHRCPTSGAEHERFRDLYTGCRLG